MSLDKLNNEMLKYDRVKGNSEKQFKKQVLMLVISSNESYQRINGKLPIGQVKLSSRSLVDDIRKFSGGMIELSYSTVNKYLRELEEEGIIEPIFKGKAKQDLSVYKIA